MYVTVVFPQGVQYHTNQWYLEASEDWTVQQLCMQICEELNQQAQHKLQKAGVDLILTDRCFNVLASGDTIELVEA